MDKRYFIMADFYVWDDEEQVESVEERFLGTEGKLKLFVFEKTPTENTKYFDTATEAGAYVDKHFGGDRQFCNFESLRIVQEVFY